jgi:hypothetical protein
VRLLDPRPLDVRPVDREDERDDEDDERAREELRS